MSRLGGGELGASLAQELKFPANNVANQTFVTAFKGMLAKDQAQRPRLVSRARSETLEDLGNAVAKLATTLETSRKAPQEHVGGR